MSTTSHHVTCPTCGHVGHPLTNPRTIPVLLHKGDGHHRVLKALKKPRTADEVAAKLGASPNEVASRLLELRRAGLAEYVVDADTGKLLMRDTSRGAKARVQRMTGLGKARLSGAA
ncbi:MAG: hypothetical protein KTQ12_03600 [Dermatophilaceae bacterium]|jgi:transcription initiation factor IIE alpha subunit|nr:hypothetical protein [Dermatophilaceae bacterium]